MVVDGAGWHRNHTMLLPPNLKLMFPPPFASELNPAEHLWDELREEYLHNCAFDIIDALADHPGVGLQALEGDQDGVKGICQWPWIVNAIPTGN